MFNSVVFLRIGRTDEIERQIDSSMIKFGCPANWINYANNHPDGIADKYEAVFAHVRKDDPRLSMICDDGVPLNRYRSLWSDEEPDGSVYARYIYSCLVPTVCFYSIDKDGIRKNIPEIDGKHTGFTIDLDPYYQSINVDLAQSSIMVICSPHLLFEDLKEGIPRAIASARNVSKDNFEVSNPYAVKYVSYDLDIRESFFHLSPYDEVFRKRPQYRDQHEARVIIPNVNFIRDPVYCKDLYCDNEIYVQVSNIKDYSMIVPADKCNRIIIEDFDRTFQSYYITLRHT